MNANIENNNNPKTELDKINESIHNIDIIGEFLEWLKLEKMYYICTLENNEYQNCFRSVNSLLGEYFSIDGKKLEKEQLEKEQKEILNSYRELNKK